MIPRSRWIPLLALALTLGLAASARAQDRQYQAPGGMFASLRITFGPPHHWAGIEGTRVEELPAAERPDYDTFRYGGTYYAYNNGRWYSSPQERGDYAIMDERAVPREFASIPREHWRNPWRLLTAAAYLAPIVVWARSTARQCGRC